MKIWLNFLVYHYKEGLQRGAMGGLEGLRMWQKADVYIKVVKTY